MGENVKASFYLPEELDAAVAAMVEEGLFTTKTDVYQEAVRRLLVDYDRLAVAEDDDPEPR